MADFFEVVARGEEHSEIIIFNGVGFVKFNSLIFIDNLCLSFLTIFFGYLFELVYYNLFDFAVIFDNGI